MTPYLLILASVLVVGLVIYDLATDNKLLRLEITRLRNRIRKDEA